MSEHNFAVSVVTPDGIVYEYDTATLVVLNTTSGEVGVMANHVPIISALRIDEARVIDSANDLKKSLAINGGFAEFSDNKLTIVGDSAELADQIDLRRAESARQRAERRLREAQTDVDAQDHDMDRLQVALRRAVNRIHVADGK
ncbi:MAG: F0F1 ATP synthase subunit epsilon [Lactobacillaceae bacterium]|jgi:F-type H+-transporting ATPase subunit epsilon|nr:F0F1 ATP synthase subunit epsilon [Lactobacillaceae bacterium]